MQAAADVLQEAHKAHIAGDYGRAEYLYCKIISHAENHSAAYHGIGTLYAQLHAHGRAITFLKKAIEIEPKANGAMENLAAVYREMEDRDRARHWGEKALALAKTPIALSNMAGTYINDGDPEPALKWADEALALGDHPFRPQAMNHKALALLEMGRFTEGWEVYDARLDLPNFTRRVFSCPMWDGKPVKRLAIHGEQGLGDEIMFMTLWPQLKHLAEEVEIEVATRLVTLMQRSFPEAKVYGKHEDRPFEPDAYIPMGSLPRLCWPVKKNTYLKPPGTYPKGTRKRVGLSWHGGTLVTHSRLRNVPVSDWKTFLGLDAEFISLQYGDRADEAEELGIPHDAEAIADLDKLAAMIMSCDLVISVCNTTVHMAGALGVPCIVLTPKAAAWRYGLTGGKMVWYDSPILVRQDGPWADAFVRAKLKAEELLANHRELSRTQFAAA
jgi:hypothetical protein